MPESTPFSAQVVLTQRASGTADRAERAQRAFSANGFEIGHCVGNSFAITGTAQDFLNVFGATLDQRADGGVAVNGGESNSGLPLHQLPATLHDLVDAVVFSEPPAFGPGAP